MLTKISMKNDATYKNIPFLIQQNLNHLSPLRER